MLLSGKYNLKYSILSFLFVGYIYLGGHFELRDRCDAELVIMIIFFTICYVKSNRPNGRRRRVFA